MSEFWILITATASIALVHTITGPDHYLPFIVLAKAKNWSLPKTIIMTFICGVGHVGSSVLLGFLGIALGWSLSKINFFESLRGGLAGWLYIILGFAYMIWGIRRAFLHKTHRHFDEYTEGEVFVYEHQHNTENIMQNASSPRKFRVTPWVLFLIFVLGPCEPLIPLLTYPAVKNSFSDGIIIVSIFTIITLLSMVGMVVSGYLGLFFLKTERLERYVHAIAGATLLLSGLSVVFLNL